MKTRDFGTCVREKRTDSGYGLREFAGLIGISPSYLSQIEKGQVHPPANEHIVTIADLLNVDQNEMFSAARRITDEMHDLVASQPSQIRDLISIMSRLDSEQIHDITQHAKRLKKSK